VDAGRGDHWRADCLQVGLGRYYAREFGVVTWRDADKRQPWYVMIGLSLLESGARGLGKPEWESGLVTLALAAALAFHAYGDRRFRAYSFLAPALVAYLGIDRPTASFDVDTWVWLQRAATLFASALIVIGLAEITSSCCVRSRQIAAGSRCPSCRRRKATACRVTPVTPSAPRCCRRSK
jgi:hypothetical protein